LNDKLHLGSRNILQESQTLAICESFKQHNNQQISRDKGSNKRIIVSTDVAMMEEWETRFSDGLIGDLLFIRQLPANYLANGRFIHQIV
jgi:hypothetical protein